MQVSIAHTGGAGNRASGHGKTTCSLWRPARAQSAGKPCVCVPSGTQSVSVCMCYRISMSVFEWEVMWPCARSISLHFLCPNWVQRQRGSFFKASQSTLSDQACEHGGLCGVVKILLISASYPKLFNVPKPFLNEWHFHKYY